ncbi:MAG: hypothetical protein F9K23_16350 [Bacteroidetes bacterium]|nr:MAG: hypothetical protein F9K23_16350 [Bacteroidota bacterium]
MRFLLFILICAGLILTAESCKKECHDRSNPDCENYDPCYGKQPLTADFETFEVSIFPDNWIPYSTDTLASSDVFFRAKEENVEYEWTVGSETITTRSFTRKNFPVGVRIPITLKVKRKTDFGCFPTDSVVAQTRNIFVIDGYENSKVAGYYQGYHTNNAADTFTVCIYIPEYSMNPPHEKTTISGLMNISTCADNKINVSGSESVGYKQYTFLSQDGFCHGAWGRVRVDSAFMGHIRIDYSYLKDLTDIKSQVDKTFLGKRIN